MGYVIIKLINSEKILTICDVPKENDAFKFMRPYAEWIETYFSKERKVNDLAAHSK